MSRAHFGDKVLRTVRLLRALIGRTRRTRSARPVGVANAEMRERRVTDRPDAVLRASAATLTQLLYHRIGPLTATRRGLRIVGGRRPWVALTLMSHFEQV